VQDEYIGRCGAARTFGRAIRQTTSRLIGSLSCPKNLDPAIVNNASGAALGVDIVLMETSDLLRRRVTERFMARHPETGADAAIGLWEQMAREIISIVGEGGFNSLYARSVFLTQATYPWLATSALTRQTEHRFANLRMSLEGQTPEQASEGNSLLMITFIDSLAALIGEELTSSILLSAWGKDASDRAGKELENE
jgi:hypothetical protein